MALKLFALKGLKTDRQTEQKLGHAPAIPSVRRPVVLREALPLPDPRLLLAALRAEHICWRQPCFLCAVLNNEPIADDDLRAVIAEGPGSSAAVSDPVVAQALGYVLAWLQASARERHCVHQEFVKHTAARNAARARLAACIPEPDERQRQLRVAMCQLIEKRPATAKVPVLRPTSRKSSQ